MGATKIYTAFDPPPAVGVECVEESLARQSEADQADINKIVARFEKTGMLPVNQREALYVDVSEVPDYRTLVEHIREVDEYFMSLPAGVRVQFENDPAEFLDAVVDPEQRERMVSLGVLPAVEEPPEKVEVKKSPEAKPAPVVEAPPKGEPGAK